MCANFPLPAVSGGRKRTLALIESMQRAGLKPRILTLDSAEIDSAEVHDRGWTVERFSHSGGDLRSRLRQHILRVPSPFSPELVARLRQLAPSSVLVQLEEIGVAQYVTVTHSLAPTLVSLHNVDSSARASASANASVGSAARAAYHTHRMRVVETRAARLAMTIICVSPADRDHFARIGCSNPTLAPNGVDPEFLSIETPASSGEAILFFGQASWAPNVEGMNRFLELGWPRVTAAVPSARLRIAGPSSERAFAAARSTPGVELLGLVDSIVDELLSSRAVVAPLWSGGGTRIKVLEAMASARPVVGTPLAVEQLGFNDGHHGLLADSPEGLGDALITVLTQPERANQLGKAARELAAPFEWSLSTAPAEAIYRTLRLQVDTPSLKRA